VAAVVTIAALAAGAGAASRVHAQESCEETPEGRVCRVQQPISRGTEVSVDLQRQLGLVTISTGCSGTLLNRYWVLTARHCATTNGRITGPLNPPGQVTVTAAWAPGRVGVPTRFHELAVNTGPGVVPNRDMILIYLGAADLGAVNVHRLYIGFQQIDVAVRPSPRRLLTVDRWVGRRLTTTDTVTQYGQGFSTFATGVVGGVPPAATAGGVGVYRSAPFTPSNITATQYDLAMNATNQVGHGGDSGGPTVVTVNGVGVGIAGVQSTCAPSGYLPGAPVPPGATSPGWQWATGISSCTYVSVEPFVREIGRAIQESPECRLGAACGLPAIVDYIFRR
jgi:hypothetical protein